MPLLSPPRCPRCSCDVPLEPLWKVSSTDHSNFLRGCVGIRCPQCGARIRILQARAYVGVIAAYLLFLTLAYQFNDYLVKTASLSKNRETCCLSRACRALRMAAIPRGSASSALAFDVGG